MWPKAASSQEMDRFAVATKAMEKELRSLAEIHRKELLDTRASISNLLPQGRVNTGYVTVSFAAAASLGESEEKRRLFASVLMIVDDAGAKLGIGSFGLTIPPGLSDAWMQQTRFLAEAGETYYARSQVRIYNPESDSWTILASEDSEMNTSR
jgi:hypothetical protein